MFYSVAEPRACLDACEKNADCAGAVLDGRLMTCYELNFTAIPEKLMARQMAGGFRGGLTVYTRDFKWTFDGSVGA